MTDRTTLLALAERCEQAAGPDRELDCHIHAPIEGRNIKPERWIETVKVYGHMVPRYTASLDAAVTLVPEGWAWGKFFGGSAECVSISGPAILFERGLNDKPALAICAAALRARAVFGEKK